MVSIKTGIYRHYKGNEYHVLGIAMHSETREVCVLYKPLYECEFEYFVRPFAMFSESVSIDGVLVQRFSFIGPYEEST